MDLPSVNPILQDFHVKLSPKEFEKLVYALLTAMGFSDVVLTGKTGDGGIDLKGIWTPSQEFAPGLQINLSFVIQAKRTSPKKTINPIYLRALKGSMNAGEWGLLITTGKISPATRQEGLKNPDKIVSTIGGLELVQLCTKYNVAVRQHFSFDKSLLKLTESEEPTEPPLIANVPNDLTTILSTTLNEKFKRIGNTPFYKSPKRLVIARWSQKYNDKVENYWYGLKARDLVAVKSQNITDFAYVLANKGVILLPKSKVINKITQGELTRSPKDGPLMHYHIRFYAEDGLQWVLKDGGRENVDQYFHGFL